MDKYNTGFYNRKMILLPKDEMIAIIMKLLTGRKREPQIFGLYTFAAHA